MFEEAFVFEPDEASAAHRRPVDEEPMELMPRRTTYPKLRAR